MVLKMLLPGHSNVGTSKAKASRDFGGNYPVFPRTEALPWSSQGGCVIQLDPKGSRANRALVSPGKLLGQLILHQAPARGHQQPPKEAPLLFLLLFHGAARASLSP